MYLMKCYANKTETGEKKDQKLKKIKLDNQSDVRIDHS